MHKVSKNLTLYLFNVFHFQNMGSPPDMRQWMKIKINSNMHSRKDPDVLTGRSRLLQLKHKTLSLVNKVCHLQMIKKCFKSESRWVKVHSEASKFLKPTPPLWRYKMCNGYGCCINVSHLCILIFIIRLDWSYNEELQLGAHFRFYCAISVVKISDMDKNINKMSQHVGKKHISGCYQKVSGIFWLDISEFVPLSFKPCSRSC